MQAALSVRYPDPVADLSSAIKRFQRFAGLPETGERRRPLSRHITEFNSTELAVDMFTLASSQLWTVMSTASSVQLWRRGVVVTELVVSTKLFYVEPG